MILKISIHQEEAGRRYKGQVDFGGNIFFYEIHLGVHIDCLEMEFQKISTIAAVGWLQQVFPIYLRDGRKNSVLINYEEYVFLLQYIGSMASEFHHLYVSQGFGRKSPYIAKLLERFGGSVLAILRREYIVKGNKIPSLFHPPAG